MREPAFLVTDECARLARWLRLCGYDTALMNARPLSALYRRAYAERRIVVTRNRRVPTSSLVHVVHVQSMQLADQLQQLVRELGLAIDADQALSRCDRCNVEVELIEKALVKDRVPPYVFETQRAFRCCPSCQRIYWMATHCQRITRTLEALKGTHA